MNFQKPHYRLRGKEYVIMSNELTQNESGGVPAWMREKSKGVSLGNVDANDLKPPRLKLLAGMSPEVMQGTPGAVPGNFWLTIHNLNLGQSVVLTPVIFRKSYQLWAPKTPANAEQKGPLASASDGIHWDTPNQIFEVRFPNNPKVYKWKIGRAVTEFNMHRFGSSQDDDPKSKPAATLTYDCLVLVDLPNGSKQLAVWTSARTGVTPTQNWISTITAMGVDQYYQRYKVVVQRKPGPSGDPYFTYDYQYIGNVQSEAEGDKNRALYEQYVKSGFVVDLEAEAADLAASKPQSSPVYEAPMDDKDDIPF
jgi:hypothetical protein